MISMSLSQSDESILSDEMLVYPLEISVELSAKNKQRLLFSLSLWQRR